MVMNQVNDYWGVAFLKEGLHLVLGHLQVGSQQLGQLGGEGGRFLLLPLGGGDAQGKENSPGVGLASMASYEEQDGLFQLYIVIQRFWLGQVK